MPDLDQQLLDQNPWWANPDAIRADPHLTELSKHLFQWNPPVEAAIPLRGSATHTLRGPRQVGKTTTVKRLIRTLLNRGERRVLYFSLDLYTDFTAIPDVIRRARALHPEPEGTWFIFFDEITAVENWARGVKYLWDQGFVRNDLMILTGSSAYGIKLGSEQLPGRRGEGRDFLQLPISFRDFCRQIRDIELPEETLYPGDTFTPEGQALLKRLNLQISDLETAWADYLKVGGFPAAVASWLRSGKTPEEFARMLWAIIASDVSRAGRNATSALKLLEEINISLGSFLKWTGAASAMDVRKTDTAKEYVHLLAESFLLLTVYFLDLGGHRFQPQKQRKVYFVDPLISRIAPSLMPGARTAQLDGLKENLVCVGLYRSGIEALVQTGPIPGGLGYWRGKRGREIDFVLPPQVHEQKKRFLPIEVKGDTRSQISSARLAIRNVFKSGIVLSNTVFDWDDQVPVIPVPVYLASLEERTRRTALRV